MSLVITSCPVLHRLSCPHRLGMNLAVLSPYGWTREQQMDSREMRGLGLLPLSVFLGALSIYGCASWPRRGWAFLRAPGEHRCVGWPAGKAGYGKTGSEPGHRHGCSEGAALESKGGRSFCLCPRDEASPVVPAFQAESGGRI